MKPGDMVVNADRLGANVYSLPLHAPRMAIADRYRVPDFEDGHVGLIIESFCSDLKIAYPGGVGWVYAGSVRVVR